MPSGVTITCSKNRVEVRGLEDDELLAYCWIGDDSHLEFIADTLSAKGLSGDAMKLRKMAQDARKPVRMTGL